MLISAEKSINPNPKPIRYPVSVTQAYKAPSQINESRSRVQNALSENEQKIVAQLKKRDREVRAHEQAHKAVGGQYVIGGANFSYETGPDGRRYAVSGEVQIDVSKVPGDPKATIRKMQQVRKAALAPVKPSAQDRRVAALASRLETEARQELNTSYNQPARKQPGQHHSIEQPFYTYTSDFTLRPEPPTSSLINMIA